MTHEVTANAEADAGPENDASLPEAEQVRVYKNPADSDGPEFDDEPPTDSELLPVLDAERNGA